MANEGSKYVKNKTRQEVRKLFLNYVHQSRKAKEFQLGKLNADRSSATLPDGTTVDVEAVGFPGEYEVVSKIHNTAVAAYRDLQHGVVDGKKEKAYVLEKTDQLYLREVNKVDKYPLPLLLPSEIKAENYTGGFSANGDHLFIGGATVADGGANVVVYWMIFSNWSILDNQFVYESITAGSENLNSVFASEIAPQIGSPQSGEETTLGLAGSKRYKYLYYFLEDNYEVPDDPPTADEIVEFVNFLIEYFEMTDEDVELLFPPEFWAAALNTANSDSLRFNPNTFWSFDAKNFPYDQYGFDGLPGWYNYDPNSIAKIIGDFWTGFFNDEYSPENNIKPYFREVGLIFNNDYSGNPVLDIVATYETTDIYVKDSSTTETSFNKQATYVVSVVTYTNFTFKRNDNEVYSYSYDENLVYQSREDRIVSVTYVDPLHPGYNFHMSALGGHTTIDGENSLADYRIYYSVAALAECERGLWATCPYYQFPTPTIVGQSAVGAAANDAFGGHPYFSQTLYPPDYSEYVQGKWDSDTDITYIFRYGTDDAPVYPGGLTFFYTAYPYYYEPYFFGYFCLDDAIVWGGTEPQANLVQTGRGVMSIKNANGSKSYSYIDRPPAAPRHYDSIWRVYLGINGTRALLTKDSVFSAYAYASDYTTTTNQIVGLDPPDTFTDVYFIDQGTWPYEADQIKPVNSRDFVQYNTTTDNSGNPIEVITNLRVNADGSVEVGKYRYGALTSSGTVLDFVILGSNYEE